MVLPIYFFSGVRQSVYRNLRFGQINCLANTKAFRMTGDRLLCTQEYFFHMCFGEELALDTLHVRLPELERNGGKVSGRRKNTVEKKRGAEPSSAVPAKKRRANSTPTFANASVHPWHAHGVDLAGNGMCLPDLACILFPVVLSPAQPNFGEHGPAPRDCKIFLDEAPPATIFDPTGQHLHKALHLFLGTRMSLRSF